jgi:uncharacterized protein YprB with RNaseH-like and TPR domain
MRIYLDSKKTLKFTTFTDKSAKDILVVQKKKSCSIKLELYLEMNKGTLLDLETTGIPNKNSEHEIICFGYTVSNKLNILCRKSKNKILHYEEISPLVKKLAKPFYAFNAIFEKEILEKELGVILGENEFIDLFQPFKFKATSLGLKWPRLDDLVSLPEKYFGETQISGKDCPELWKMYLDIGDENLLKMIIKHNLTDLLREVNLLMLYF